MKVFSTDGFKKHPRRRIGEPSKQVAAMLRSDVWLSIQVENRINNRLNLLES